MMQWKYVLQVSLHSSRKRHSVVTHVQPQWMRACLLVQCMKERTEENQCQKWMQRMWTLSTTNLAVSDISLGDALSTEFRSKNHFVKQCFSKEKKSVHLWWRLIWVKHFFVGENVKICQMIMLFNPFLMQSEEPVNVGAVTNDKWIVPLQINQSLILQWNWILVQKINYVWVKVD